MLDLGLARISRLVSSSSLSWRAIHVAGTNGKGSVCAYISAMLNVSGVRCGRFTSPHLIHRWDCISIAEKAVEKDVFQCAEDRVMLKNKERDIGATEFELLTGTAFEVFSREGVEIGVVEVGIGGRLDATNILENPLVTVITKIGKDHESLLGNTLEQIAYQKAGIMKKGVPCVIDGTNQPGVMKTLKDYANQVQAGPLITISDEECERNKEVWGILNREQFEPHQRVNICVAYEALKQALRQIQRPQNPTELLTAVSNISWPGRLQLLSVESLTGRSAPILLDGAHNPQSAEVLASYVNRRLRNKGEFIIWIIAASRTKDMDGMFSLLLRPGDSVAAVEFGPVDGMPWVEAEPAENLARMAKNFTGLTVSFGNSLQEALSWATENSDGSPIIVAGSLYLVSDLLRLLENEKLRQTL
ncbi:folylpolyglutamate synthase [Bachmanniomyces sp. S44760]|nr:folylpolyglutamate synthase [Bachmanniomyces sp. S44760]